MAAGSVMSDPSSGASVRIVSHHAAGVAPPSAATRASVRSARARIGWLEASAMITTTKSASVKATPPSR